MNAVLDYLKKNKIPLTRQNYLEIAYMGDPPEKLGAEEEADIPPEISGASGSTSLKPAEASSGQDILSGKQ